MKAIAGRKHHYKTQLKYRLMAFMIELSICNFGNANQILSAEAYFILPTLSSF